MPMGRLLSPRDKTCVHTLFTSDVTYTIRNPRIVEGARNLKGPQPILCYSFATLCKIQLRAQNLTLQEGPNILRYATDLHGGSSLALGIEFKTGRLQVRDHNH
ncbi:hypothetical protein TNCV_5137011 [Trichonephila clavipes]|nr:hypothetical protein TNCV_5137011 [Trichonephila clavipes]